MAALPVPAALKELPELPHERSEPMQQHGLSSNKMALMTSDRGKMRSEQLAQRVPAVPKPLPDLPEPPPPPAPRPRRVVSPWCGHIITATRPSGSALKNGVQQYSVQQYIACNSV